MSTVEHSLADSLVYAGRTFELDDGFVIGSGATAKLRIDRDEVDEVHAVLRRTTDGWILENQGATPVIVAGDAVPPSRGHVIHDGDVLIVGDRAIAAKFGDIHRTAPAGEPAAGGFVVGRDDSCELTLDDPGVSRTHAHLRAVAGGTLVEDLGSANGTWIDGRRLVAPVVAPDGTVIRIGPFSLEVANGRARRRASGAPAVEARGIVIDVGTKRILQPTSFHIPPGELVAVIGGSGAGKSTLVRAVAGVRPADAGVVLFDGVADRAGVEVGYVPQSDIVHGDLTVREALGYSAAIRLGDLPAEQRRSAVERAIRDVELTEHAETLIARLSGGQRKRASVAVELLAEPGVLVLDEPTTGLDPALDARMMTLFRRLADSGRTVIVVTHATRMLDLCDRVLLMAPGGVLAYDGTPAEALGHFGVEHADELYPAVDGAAPRPPVDVAPGRERAGNGRRPERSRRAAPLHRQVLILLARTVKLLVRDRRNLLIIAGQVPVIGLLIALLFESDVLRRPGGHPDDAAQVVFLLVTSAVWFGAIDSAREIVKERAILAREVATGLSRGAYVAAKLGVVGTVAAAQTVLVLLLVLALRPFDEPAGTLAALAAILAATAVAAVAMGLVISAITRTQDQATSLIPLAMIPQLLFAGAVIPEVRMPDFARIVTEFVFANGGYAAAGTSMHLEERIAEDAQLSRVEPFGTDFFAMSTGAGLLRLLAFTGAFALIALVALRARRA